MLIKSISHSQTEIIRNILALYVPSKRIDCDPTYSVGNFYAQTGILEPIYKFDILPKANGVIGANAENLPLADSSIGCMMFDPPFLATTGTSLKSNENNNAINKRFGTYPNEQSLHNFYANALEECYRVLDKDGILIFKCQDKVSSGKQYFSHCYIYNQAVKVGFYPIDLFILLAKSRLVANWQKTNQKHARKYHCYFWVFKKTTNKVIYDSGCF